MSYDKYGSMLKYFVPNMAISGSSTKPLAAINIAAANATHGEFICVVPCTIRSAQATVVLNTVSETVLPVITLTKYTLPGAGGTSTVIDTITIPGLSTLGQSYYVKDLAVSFVPGEVIQVKHTVGTGGSVAGEAVVSWVCENDPEVPANVSKMVLSA
jgi:hypothetical protein